MAVSFAHVKTKSTKRFELFDREHGLIKAIRCAEVRSASIGQKEYGADDNEDDDENNDG